METTRTEEQICPHCGHEVDSHTSQKGSPSKEDISICFYCGEVIMFSEYLSLLKCTDEYLKENVDEETIEEIRRIQKLIKSKL